MTSRRAGSVPVPRRKSGDYAIVAEDFWKGADTAKTFEYWNAAGVLIVHSAIAYADAVAIKLAGVKSRAEDHMAAVDLLRGTLVGAEASRKALRHLEMILAVKNRVSYEGEEFRRADIDPIWKHLERFRGWARAKLGD